MSKKAWFACIMLVILFITFCVNANIHILSGRAISKERLVPEEIYNGKDFKVASGECYCTFNVQTLKGKNFYIYMKDQEGSNDFSFYVEGGQTVSKKVPVGKYKIYYWSGDTWYGLENKFGKNSTTQKSDKILEFAAVRTSEGTQYGGYTLSLYPVPNGNLPTEFVNEKAMPE